MGMQPTLRFPEFEGEWATKRLAQLVSYQKGYAFKSRDYQSTGIRIVRASDLSATAVKAENEKIFIDPSKTDDLQRYKIKQGEIIVTTVGSKPDLIGSAVGRPIFVLDKEVGLLNQNLVKLTSVKSNSGFIFASLKRKSFLDHIWAIQRGNANQSNITIENLLEFKTGSPSLKEQTKIAEFVGAVDEKVRLLEAATNSSPSIKKP